MSQICIFFVVSYLVLSSMDFNWLLREKHKPLIYILSLALLQSGNHGNAVINKKKHSTIQTFFQAPFYNWS